MSSRSRARAQSAQFEHARSVPSAEAWVKYRVAKRGWIRAQPSEDSERVRALVPGECVLAMEETKVTTARARP